MTRDESDSHDDEGRTDELTIHVSGADLPTGEDERTAILDELGEAVGNILTENHGITADSVTGDVGPEYTQIGDGCPICGFSAVVLRDYTYTDNGSTASAYCPECEWRGSAIYRLIDYETHRPDDEWRSAVASGRKSAHYHTY